MRYLSAIRAAMASTDLYLPPAGLPLGPSYPGPARPGKTGVAAAKRAARKRRNQRRARR